MADELCMIHFSIIVEAVVQVQLMLYALLLCTASERSFKALEQSTHMLLHTPGPYTPHSLHLPHPLHMYISSFPSHPLPHSLFPISSPTSHSLLTPFLPLSPQFDADVLGCNRYSSSGRVVAIDTWNPSYPRRTNILDNNQVGKAAFCPIRILHLVLNRKYSS